MSDRLQRTLWIVFGAAVVALLGYLTLEQADGPPRAPRAPSDAGTDARAQASADVSAASREAGAAATLEELDAGLPALVLASPDAGPLPTGAPRQVRLGVILVQYAGAEGAPPSSRSKREAAALAARLAQEAKTDFRHALQSGDSGSSEDIGRVPRGVLDPSTEAAVFRLDKGDVSDVLETPRGYWIVKRSE